MAHALLSPSASSRWLRCVASPAAIKTGAWPVDDKPSAFAEEGTLAHAEAERAVREEIDGEVNDHANADADMVRHGKGWAKTCIEFAGYHPKWWAAEYKTGIAVVTGEEGAEGTTDFAAVAKDGTLVVADFKYGMGVEVEAVGNTQLTIYAAALLNELRYEFSIQRVVIVIYQPRLNERPSVWETSPADIDRRADRIRHVALEAAALCGERIDDIVKAMKPGESQCRFCPIKASCPGLRGQVEEVTRQQFEVVEAEQKPVIVMPSTSEEFARVLPWLDTIDGWVKAVREQSLSLAMNGGEIKGYKVVAGRKGARRWDDEAEQALRRMSVPVGSLYEKRLVSPTQAEKLHKTGVIGPRQWERIQAHITQSEGKPALVPESDKRPALGAPNKDAFQVIEA